LAPEHRADSVEQAADSIVALHATDQPTIYLSAWARVDGLTVQDVDTALYDARTLVKHLCMRRTLFVFTRGLLGPIQAAQSMSLACSTPSTSAISWTSTCAASKKGRQDSNVVRQRRRSGLTGEARWVARRKGVTS
jgi:hypothetical protein